MHHQELDQLSIAYHRVIAERLVQEPHQKALALERVLRWCQTGAMHPVYAQQWKTLLEGPTEILCRVLVSDTEEAKALRQSSPFAGMLSARERWAIRRDFQRTLDDQKGLPRKPGQRAA